jgi:hypothetical protein
MCDFGTHEARFWTYDVRFLNYKPSNSLFSAYFGSSLLIIDLIGVLAFALQRPWGMERGTVEDVNAPSPGIEGVLVVVFGGMYLE